MYGVLADLSAIGSVHQKKQTTKSMSAKFHKIFGLSYIIIENSKTRGQTVYIQMRRLIMSQHILTFGLTISTTFILEF